MNEHDHVSMEEIDAEDAVALPNKEVLSLLDVNANVDLGLDLAAPVDLAAAANLNVAAPIEASASANVLSQGAEAVAAANQHGAIEEFPSTVLGEQRERALLFKNLATLRTDALLFRDVDELRWRGPTDAFAACVDELGDTRLLRRCLTLDKVAHA